MINLKKIIQEVFKAIGILGIQFLSGYIVTIVFLKSDWDTIAFLTNPAMIVFWCIYAVIESVIIGISVRKSRKKDSVII